MRLLRNCAAIGVNAVVAAVLHALGALTAGGRPRSPAAVGPTTRIVVVTPLAPSDRSGGARAVLELQEILAAHLAADYIALENVAQGLSPRRRRLADLLLHDVPALPTSRHCFFGSEQVTRRVPADTTVLVEFSEGATFLALRRRLSNRTILRDHEVLLRRFVRDSVPGSSLVERLRSASQRAVCKALLANVYRKADLVVVLTEEDRRYVEQHLPGSARKLLVIPAPFRSPEATGLSATAPGAPDGRQLLFLGNLFHAPNMEALRWFVRECAPHLDDGFTLHLCGLDGPLDSERFEGTPLRLVRHGFVSDIEANLASVRVGVSPVISGGGTRVKNLYLGSTGRLVVTTPLGNQGIGFTDGVDAIIRGDGRGMARALNEVARDPARIRALGEQAARRIRENFCPERVWELYRDLVFGSVAR